MNVIGLFIKKDAKRKRLARRNRSDSDAEHQRRNRSDSDVERQNKLDSERMKIYQNGVQLTSLAPMTKVEHTPRRIVWNTGFWLTPYRETTTHLQHFLAAPKNVLRECLYMTRIWFKHKGAWPEHFQTIILMFQHLMFELLLSRLMRQLRPEISKFGNLRIRGNEIAWSCALLFLIDSFFISCMFSIYISIFVYVIRGMLWEGVSADMAEPFNLSSWPVAEMKDATEAGTQRDAHFLSFPHTFT